jgi:trehalose 6-phosphate phosphatase
MTGPHSFSLPPLTHHSALFLDFDGTLADIAPRPELAQVPPDLLDTLKALREQLDGALAIVTGRPLADITRLLHPLDITIAAEHGAVLQGQGLAHAAPQAQGLEELKVLAAELAQSHTGLQLEAKQFSISLHYRHAPSQELRCRNALRAAVAPHPELALMEGKYVLEVKPAHISKGEAIKALMQTASFAGRTPVFAGDDVTDESGFAAVKALAGAGIKVGPNRPGHISAATFHCASPRELRAWLQGQLDMRQAA